MNSVSFHLSYVIIRFRFYLHHIITLTLSKGSKCIFLGDLGTGGRSLALENFPVSLCLCKINLLNFQYPIYESFFLDTLKSASDVTSVDKVITSWKCLYVNIVKKKVRRQKRNGKYYPKYPNEEKCDRFIIHLPAVFIFKSSLFRKSRVNSSSSHQALAQAVEMAAETKSG